MNSTITKRGDRYRLVYEEVYAADLDDLWDAVTSRERLARWMADYEGDLRLGGQWSAGAGADGVPWVRGTVTACDAPHSFTTTWHAIEEEPTELVVRLEPVAGGTRLVLEHTGIQSVSYGAGWQTYLEVLVRSLAAPDESLQREESWQVRFAELDPGYRARFDSL